MYQDNFIVYFSTHVPKLLYEVWATLSVSTVKINAPNRNVTANMKLIIALEKPLIHPKNTVLRIDFL